MKISGAPHRLSISESSGFRPLQPYIQRNRDQALAQKRPILTMIDL